MSHKLNIKIISFILAITVMLGTFLMYPIAIVKADDAAFKAALNALKTGLGDNEECVRTFQLLVKEGRDRGLTDVAIAGVIANIAHEGNWNSIEGDDGSMVDEATGSKAAPHVGGTYKTDLKPSVYIGSDGKEHNSSTRGQGCGIIQWSPYGRFNNMVETLDKETKCGWFTAHVWVANYQNYGSFGGSNCKKATQNGDFSYVEVKVPGLEGQVYYLYCLDSGNGFQDQKMVDTINACTTPEDAAKWFRESRERGGAASAAARMADGPKALTVVQSFDGSVDIPTTVHILRPGAEPGTGVTDEDDGTVGGGGSASDTPSEIATDYKLDATYESMYERGIITSDQLGAYYKLQEQNMHLDSLRRDEFGAEVNEEGELVGGGDYSENLRQLSQWETNVESERLTFTDILRIICMLIGILLIIWVLLFYLSYWFDKVNTIIPFGVMPIISFGRYVVADNDSETDVNIMTPNKEKKLKQINHQGVLLLCMIAIIFASLLLSGLLFNWLRFGVLWIQRALSRLTLG